MKFSYLNAPLFTFLCQLVLYNPVPSILVLWRQTVRQKARVVYKNQ